MNPGKKSAKYFIRKIRRKTSELAMYSTMPQVVRLCPTHRNPSFSAQNLIAGLGQLAEIEP